MNTVLATMESNINELCRAYNGVLIGMGVAKKYTIIKTNCAIKKIDLESLEMELEMFLNIQELKAKNRKKEIVMARHWFSFIAFKTLKYSQMKVASYLGFDRTSLIHGRDTFMDIYSTDEKYRFEFLNFVELLDGKGFDTFKIEKSISQIKII